jgi:2-methylisoborneol synthase
VHHVLTVSPRTSTRGPSLFAGGSLYCPEPVRVDEDLGAEVNDRLLDWVDEVGIFPGKHDHVRACDYGRYAMLIHPDTDDPDRLLLAAQCMAALFAVDDYYCDDERTGSDPVLIGPRLTLAQVALDPTYLVTDHATQLDAALNTDPVLVALRSYIDRVARFATPAQVSRVRHETVAMFVTMSGEAGWRITGRTPPTWEYLAARQANSFLPCMTLVDIIGGYELPAAVYSHPLVRRATMLAASTSIILNDLYSMAKESEPGIADYSLPLVIAAERGCSLREATAHAAAIHNRLMRNFEEARTRLTATFGSPELEWYLTGLHAWLGGSREWHGSSGRYRS